MRITTKTIHRPLLMGDDFAFRYARIYPGVNSRAELVALAPGLRPERRFAPLARENRLGPFIRAKISRGLNRPRLK